MTMNNSDRNIINLYSSWLVARLTFGYSIFESPPTLFRELFEKELEEERNLVLKEATGE